MKNSCTLDDKQLSTSLTSQGKHPDVPSSSSDEITIDIGDKPCICKVPIRLRKINAAAYTPQVISIGPLHWGQPRIMDQHKPKYLNQFCERNEMDSSDAAAMKMENSSKEREEKYCKRIKAQEKKIKCCYAENIDHNDFAEMVLKDAAFIIELFLGTKEGQSDWLIHNPLMRIAIKQDLILLENQLPYFILEELYEYAFPITKTTRPFQNLVSNYFKNYIKVDADRPTKKSASDCCFPLLYCYASDCFSPNEQTKEEKPTDGRTKKSASDCCVCFSPKEQTNPKGEEQTEEGKPTEEEQKPKHLTDFVRKERLKKFMPSLSTENNEKSKYRPIPANKLQKAGVRFKVSSHNRPRGVIFAKGELTMPPFIVDDSAECLYRNLMAFEQLFCPSDAYFCNYITFMNFLIDTPEDVDLLVESGVINHRLGDNQALSKLVNDLDKEIEDRDNRYDAILAALDKHYQNRWIGWVAFMREVYFTNFWKGTATTAAFIFLIINLTTSIISCINSF